MLSEYIHLSIYKTSNPSDQEIQYVDMWLQKDNPLQNSIPNEIH